MFKSVPVLESYLDEELISLLKEEWGVEKDKKIIVTGILELISFSNNEFVVLKDIESIDGSQIEYPVENLAHNEQMSNRGIFVSNLGSSRSSLIASLKKEKNILVKAELELAELSERKKHDNPLLLQVNYGTVKPVTEINSESIVKNNKGNVLINESVYNASLHEALKDSSEEIEKIKAIENEKLEKELLEKRAVLESENIKIETDITKLENKTTQIEKEQKSTQKNIIKQKEKYQAVTEKLNQSFKEKHILDSELVNIKNMIKQEKENHMKKIEKFRAYVKSQADTLLSLEFIDENEYNDILIIKNDNLDETPTLNFSEDLNSDISKAISHVQAYLYEKDILYPRYILEDYLALIQTNDLIILAGESGSGKTNLVKSFAEAVGGKCRVIPVKPNWTSSEDLLGYYNPLEKKYLSTPFLDALLEASKDPETPYFICLDEMNLARIEYYFADFLSLLESREDDINIHLYSDDESSHVLSEFKNVLEIIKSTKEKYKKGNIVNFVQLLQDEEINSELKRIFGFSDKDSLIKYHSDLRRMISGIINIPSSIQFPKNVRIIGAINIDETTHYLSPKILDRAHIMKFDSPLLFNWKQIEEEIKSEHDHKKVIKLEIEHFDMRNKYPRFVPENDFCSLIAELTKDFFTPLGVEVGLRTIRQGLNYQDKLGKLNPNQNVFLHNFFTHKIFPKLNFDGSKMLGDIDKKDLLLSLQSQLSSGLLKNNVNEFEGVNANIELENIIVKAKTNDWIVNYWA